PKCTPGGCSRGCRRPGTLICSRMMGRFATAGLLLMLVPCIATPRDAFAKRTASQCEKLLDATVPEATRFDHEVDFDIGATNLPKVDSIVIREVRGTGEGFEVGQFYLVRGDYSLGSTDEAVLHVSVAASRRGEGCTTGNSRGRVKI